ncbi:Fumarylacetoacetase [Zea mays]|uniref:Fumarylacetoacetase n=1 Tax=Zea mays TaxID=4577 RepID=A0A1D6QRD1_MAIZE|nr:Fumarylacetoacetase [Zea mays]
MAEPSQQLRSFVEVPAGSHFPIQNLPFGVFRRRGVQAQAPRPAVAIGDFALDLAAVADAGLFDGPALSGSPCFHQETLNMFLGMGRPAWREARATLQKILSADEPVLRDNEALRNKCLVPMSDIEMVLPITVGGYTDFFCSVHHAMNCGFIFRGPQTPVNPNWFYLPVGYNGRASSIVVSGTNVIRPRCASQNTC